MAEITITPSSLTLDRYGTAQTARLTTVESAALVADTVPDWLSVSPARFISDSSTEVTVSAAENTGQRRSCTVRFQYTESSSVYAELSVTQAEGTGFELRHYGEFLDVNGNTWRCEVLRKGYTGDSSEVTFPADSPLVIEWPSINFEDSVWGSSATLRVVSPGDRTYIDLYTIEPGTVRLDVYRNGSLYWSGMLDTEFYEEPYERLSGYEVELTFTDFGILDRLKYDLDGQRTVREIIDRAVELTGIPHAVYETVDGETAQFFPVIGLRWYEDREPESDPLFHNGISVASENFTDEEGEVSTWREALEGVLAPLGLTLAQRGGEVVLFDPEGLREEGQARAAVWSGDSQTLGVDRVYNSVTVTFSPYAKSEVIEDAVRYTGEYDPTWYDTTPNNANRYTTGHGQNCSTFFPTYSGKYNTGFDNTDLDFTIFTGSSALLDGATFTTGQSGHVLPVYGSAEECDCWVYGFWAGNWAMDEPLLDLTVHGNPPRNSPTSTDRTFTLARVRLPAVPDSDERGKWALRLVQEILADCRYNPFSDAGDYNEGDNQNRMQENSAFVFIRAAAVIYDAQTGGNALYHYDNSAVAQGDGENSMKFGEWKSGDDPDASLWLEFYDPDDMTDNSAGAGGWKANRHCVGKPDGREERNEHSQCLAALRNADDGEYIPYPPAGGWLEIALTPSIYGYKWKSNTAVGEGTDDWGAANDDSGARYWLRWRLYRAAEVHLVRNGMFFDAADLDDVEYRGTLDAAAQDDLGIDTVCGTCEDAPPTARGVYVTPTGAQVPELYRGGVTARVEELLIGQLYSQYAGRKTVLTGEAETPETLLLTEDNQEGKTFILTADSEDIRMAVSDIEIRELGEDTYTPES